MKITKKLAQEIFNGNFENVPFTELQEGNRTKTNLFDDYVSAKSIYSAGTTFKHLIKKDFQGLEKLTLVKAPNERYGKNFSSKNVMTDVIELSVENGKYYLTLSREKSTDYKDYVIYQFNEQTKQEITDRIIKNLPFIIE